MSETTNTTPSVFAILELYHNVSKRSVEYAGLIGFSIGTLRRIKTISNDEAIKLECDYAITYLGTELDKILDAKP